MFVRPPIGRTRNPGRQPGPPRMPNSEINRPLLRQFVRNRRSDPRYEAYIIEVREGPYLNGNTNAAASKSNPQPWVTVRDYSRDNQSIGLPVSICDALLTHLLTSASTPDAINLDNSDVSGELLCASPEQNSDQQASSPAGASGDARSPNEQTTSEADSQKSPSQVKSRLFQLTRLKSIRIVCEATGCTLEVTDRDPSVKSAAKSTEEDQETVVQVDPSRRWIISTPSESKSTTNNDALTETDARSTNNRRQPWDTRGNIELHESLMTQLAAFLTDVVTRYKCVIQLPEVKSLYSASGGRRFFFDLRDTRWGKRLHISQVTDLHRNVIGIPLEALVSFRTRLDTFIQSLSLEDQHTLKSEISSGNFPTRGQPNMTTSPQGKSYNNENKQWGTPNGNGRSGGGSGRQRGGRDRRQRMRSFTTASNTSGGNAGAPQSDDVNDANGEQTVRKVNSNVSTASGAPIQMNNGFPRNRRFARRDRNQRPFNRIRRQPQGEEPLVEGMDGPAIQSAPEPAIDRNRVTAVAEASA